MENKCLYCYKEIPVEELQTTAGKAGYHQRCCKVFFETPEPPRLDFTQDQILEVAEQVIKSQKTVTGVQPKLSLGFNKESETPDRMTIVGLWGEYILKPQTELYPYLPENEDLTMHLAQISKIKTVPHGLIRLKSAELAYITKRVDRKGSEKNHMEDMCQLTERLTEHKYKGSYEQIAKAIKKFSANPGFDLVNFYELVLFSFLTGNNDMHLKNFSLLKENEQYMLSPAYDLLASSLVVEGDDEDLALHLNGKKKKIRKSDFQAAMKMSGLNEKVIDNIFKKYKKLIPKWLTYVETGFLSDIWVTKYQNMIIQKATQLSLK